MNKVLADDASKAPGTLSQQDFSVHGSDGKPIQSTYWPARGPVRAAVQIAHGMGEHRKRYDRVAVALNNSGYEVYANDHRGHGDTDPDEPGNMGPDGWNATVQDAYLLNDHIRRTHPQLPRILLGHSMGAMLTQQYLYRYGHSLHAAVISGSPGFGHPVRGFISQTIARFEAWRHGADAQSDLLQNLLFGKANDNFDGDDATGFEWLSRDAAEVQKYIDDPYCGFVLRAGNLVELFAGARQAARPDNINTIPKNLPILVFSGAADPVHGEGKNITRLLTRYRNAGLHVSSRMYPDGRHEMFNETNAQEVIDDVITWLNARFSPGD